MDFCAAHSVDPDDTTTNLVPHLQVFARRIRDGRLSSSRRAVRADTVANALRNVGQTHARLGSLDIQNDPTGRVDLRLSRQLRYYDKEDNPPRRVKPVPISVVASVVRRSHADHELDAASHAIADMICLGFFFLCRPGEHTLTNDNIPFTLRDVNLYRQ